MDISAIVLASRATAALLSQAVQRQTASVQSAHRRVPCILICVATAACVCRASAVQWSAPPQLAGLPECFSKPCWHATTPMNHFVPPC